MANLTNISNFHPLEVVGHGSETQLHVSEHLNNYSWTKVKTIPLFSG